MPAEVLSRPSVQIESLGQVALTVRNLARATTFYRDTLGLTFLFNAGSMAFLQLGTVRLMLGLETTPSTPNGTILYYKVADILTTHAALLQQGVTFIGAPHLVAHMPDHDVWMAFLKDTEDNTLALMCELPHA